MRASVELDEQAYKAARELAEWHGKPIDQTISELIISAAIAFRIGESECEPTSRIAYERHGDITLPVFRNGPGTPVMTTTAVKQLLAEM